MAQTSVSALFRWSKNIKTTQAEACVATPPSKSQRLKPSRILITYGAAEAAPHKNSSFSHRYRSLCYWYALDLHSFQISNCDNNPSRLELSTVRSGGLAASTSISSNA